MKTRSEGPKKSEEDGHMGKQGCASVRRMEEKMSVDGRQMNEYFNKSEWRWGVVPRPSLWCLDLCVGCVLAVYMAKCRYIGIARRQCMPLAQREHETCRVPFSSQPTSPPTLLITIVLCYFASRLCFGAKQYNRCAISKETKTTRTVV